MGSLAVGRHLGATRELTLALLVMLLLPLFAPIDAALAASVASTFHSIPARAMHSSGVETQCYDPSGFTCAGGGYNGTSAQIGGLGWSAATYWNHGSSGASGTRHNCTTYAAFRLQQNGYAYPQWHDNANGWARQSALRGVSVDQTPAVGAIAQWNSGDGHVAYVEVVTGTYIITTSDSFNGGTDRQQILRSSSYMPDNFIHFKDQDSTGSVADNGGFERGSWSPFPGTSTNYVSYRNGQVPGLSAHSGLNMQATNTGSSGGGVYQDVPLSATPGGVYCGSAWVAGLGASGSFTVWLMGGAYLENGSAAFSGLTNSWTQVSTCVAATTPQTVMRIQIYVAPNRPTLFIDDIDIH